MRIVVIRTSAMGDVALAVPVLNALKIQYPDVETILVTRKPFNAFFRQDRSLILFNPDFRERHKGLKGIIRLFNDLNAIGKIDHVIDIHNVLRTKILSALFRLKGVKVSVVDKGRKEKHDLIRGRRKVQLKHTVERYCDTFASAGLKVLPETSRSIDVSHVAEDIAQKLIGDSAVRNVGIAPFAKHSLKMWPEKYMQDLINIIIKNHQVRFWFFGGDDEIEKINSLASQNPGSMNLCGKLSLEEELAVISRLDMMIAMDSSNMHMAALCGIKVVSIWGGTDPLNGFGAWMQPQEYSVRIPVDELTCRPCTVYGKGICRRGDLACMNWLTPEMVYQQITKLNIL
jgi:ADP-heptose:LPS heptosyltransferase